ncbi:hypothetical protein F5Y03DRAFT_330780 [Xylaria venustula]|nr:hypothetical protein F5Y03DRAFT_330780 [Xylaria venustula]
MQLSWLLRYTLLLVVAIGGASVNGHEASTGIEVASTILVQNSPEKEGLALREAVITRVARQQFGTERLLIRGTDPTKDSVERGPAAVRISCPTAAPPGRKRQDDGQIQALSAQLQSVSQSATQAISSVSSSASSVLSQISQSAQSVQQVAQSASQAADQASRQLSQTISSASSAVSAANARATDQMSQSLASMSSRISANQASAQSSASDAISSARVAASQFAASQIEAARVSSSSETGATNPSVNEKQSNSVSASTIAIITTVSIVGTAILSVVSSCLFLRYRRKRASQTGEALTDKEKRYEKPVAVRGSLNPHFPRFGRDSRSPTPEFRLPSLSPLIQSKKAQREAKNNIGSAVSDFGDQAENRSTTRLPGDVNNTQPQIFRLQKDNGISSATTVRLIRVGSEKSKAGSFKDIQQTASELIPPPPTINMPDQSPGITPAPIANQPTTQFLTQDNPIITEPSRVKRSSSEERRDSGRSMRNSDAQSPSPTIPAETTRNRFMFRDSSDMESAEPTPTNRYTASLTSNPDMSGIPAQRLRGQGRGGFNRTTSSGRPKNGGGTFATFPRIRNEAERESMINRGRPNRTSRAAGTRREESR